MAKFFALSVMNCYIINFVKGSRNNIAELRKFLAEYSFVWSTGMVSEIQQWIHRTLFLDMGNASLTGGQDTAAKGGKTWRPWGEGGCVVPTAVGSLGFPLPPFWASWHMSSAWGEGWLRYWHILISFNLLPSIFWSCRWKRYIFKKDQLKLRL